MAWIRRRTGSPTSPTLYIALAVAVVLAVTGVVWFRSRGGEAEPTNLGRIAAAGPADSAAPTVPPLALPELDASDTFIRNVIGSLSAHPQFARWLVTDELARRFVLSVVEVAGGRSPRAHVPFLVPEEAPNVRESGETLTVDPATYRRYNLLAETFVSLDTNGTAVLYHQLHPLFVEAYDELGIPGGSFDEAMALAVSNLLSAREATGSLAVRPSEGVYQFVDPELEALTPVEKHFVRLGPENAVRVQSKLRDIWSAIGGLRRASTAP